MKKNKMMRVASALLIAVLLTTSAISGTFAKYTTQDSANDSARVAKWGVALQVVGSLYGDHYANGANSAPIPYVDANTASVTSSSQGTDVVAPGTVGDTGLTFNINGTPEVSGVITATIAYENIYLMTGKYGVMISLGTIGQVEYNAYMAATEPTDRLYTVSSGTYTLATEYNSGTTYYTLEDYVDLTENYYPVEYSMTGTTTNYNTGYTTATTVDQLAAIATAVGGKFGTADSTVSNNGLTTVTYSTGKVFNPNESLATVMGLQDQNITWKWDFEQATNEAMYSKADTILGNLQAGTPTVVKMTAGSGSADTWAAPTAATGENANDYNLETSFSIDITVTQTD